MYHIYMNIIKLFKNQRLFLTIQNISEILGINEVSACNLASRYVKKDVLIRLKKNIYVLRSKVNQLQTEDQYYLSNIIQTPSYISLMTALSYYEITTQITRNVIESISLVRSKYYEKDKFLFNYTKIKPVLYFGFERKENFFIAIPEKAFIDAIYLESFGKYKLDITSIDLKKLSYSKLMRIVNRFPKRTKLRLKKIFSIYLYNE